MNSAANKTATWNGATITRNPPRSTPEETAKFWAQVEAVKKMQKANPADLSGQGWHTEIMNAV